MKNSADDPSVLKTWRSSALSVLLPSPGELKPFSSDCNAGSEGAGGLQLLGQ